MVPKLKENSPWLVSIHCLSHRLELSLKGEPRQQAAKIRGYVKIMKSFNFLSCLLAFVDLLVPIARLSQFLQGDATNLMMAKTSIDTTKKSLQSTASVHSEGLTNLIQQTESAEEKPVEFRGISLNDVKTGVAFVQTQKVNFASRITTALENRFQNFVE